MSANDRILASAHKVAEALHEVGAMDDVTMREMDKLCLPPVPTYSPAQIRRIRSSTGMSQPVFARLMGVGKSAVAQWEQGEKKPGGPALRLLEAFDRTARSPVYLVRQRQEERESGDAVHQVTRRQPERVAYPTG
jgi:putative transcriptional regulator